MLIDVDLTGCELVVNSVVHFTLIIDVVYWCFDGSLTALLLGLFIEVLYLLIACGLVVVWYLLSLLLRSVLLRLFVVSLAWVFWCLFCIGCFGLRFNCNC